MTHDLECAYRDHSKMVSEVLGCWVVTKIENI